MPVKRLSKRAYDHLENLIWESDYYFSEKEVIDGLNEYFAKMYGYKGSKAFKRYAPSKQVRSGRKLSDWQRFIKQNSNKRKFKYASGKLNLKKMGVAYRKTAAYKRNRKKKR